MHIVFANSRPALPFFFDGGAERTTFTLASGLASRGIKVTQISTFPQDDMQMAESNAQALGAAYDRQTEFRDNSVFFQSRMEHLVVNDNLLKIVAVDRSEFNEFCGALISRCQPDLLVTWLNGSEFVVRLGDEFAIPTVLRVVGPDGSHGYPPLGSKTVVLANSPLTAQICSDHYQRHVKFLLGIVDHEKYAVDSRTAKFVTYVNPRKEKGIHLFCKAAAILPEIPFLVVQGWSRTGYLKDEAAAMDFLSTLPNVTITPPVAEMAQVYGVTRVLVLPSRWTESWARVIGEAQANGIPVIGSDRGCSPQNIGRGGIVLDYGDPYIWASAVRLLYEDNSLLAKLSDYARLNVKRFDPESLLDDYERFFTTVSNGGEFQTREQTPPIEIFRGRKDGSGRLEFCPEHVTMNASFDASDPVYP